MLRQLLPEGVSGSSELLTNRKFVITIKKLGQLGIFDRRRSTHSGASRHARMDGMARQLLPKGTLVGGLSVLRLQIRQKVPFLVSV